MTPEEVIDICAAMGICLRVEGGKLKAAPPPASPLLDKLRLHRDAIIVRLKGLPLCPGCGRPPRRGARAKCNMGAGGGFARSGGKRRGGIGPDPLPPPVPAAGTQLDPPMPPIHFPEPAERYAPAHRFPDPLP